MKYRDELDKSYGIAGMALGLSVFDADDLFTAVTLDGDGPDSILFTPEFYFAGNPRLSPRVLGSTSWATTALPWGWPSPMHCAAAWCWTTSALTIR